MTALFAAIMLAGTKAQAPSSSEIISKVLAKYAAANSGTAEILMNQTGGTKKLSIKTELQFERPSKLYIHQSSETLAPGDWLIVSDGNNFGYDAPFSGQRKRLFEPVASADPVNGGKRVLKTQAIFVAGKRSLGDTTNPFLEFLTQSEGDTASIKGFMVRLFKINAATEKTIDGNAVWSIGGLMGFGTPAMTPDGKQAIDKTSGYPMFESAGRFEIQISKDYDLVAFKTVEQINATDPANNLPTNFNVITTWTGKAKLNEIANPSLFTVK